MIGNKLETKEILNKYGLRLKKSLGQNFLIDQGVLEQIIAVADICDKEVLEIGPGIGSLTEQLAQQAKKVIAVEIDQRLVSILKGELGAYNNLKIVEGDALEVDFNKYFKQEFSVIANLPYYITSPIIMRLLEGDYNINKMVFMVQKEVAERMVATPGGKDYGILSIAVQYYSKADIAFNVLPESFLPSPNVESAVIKLDVNQKAEVDVIDKEFFFTVVKAAFQQRRKIVRNSLSKAANINLDKKTVDQALKVAEIDPRIRAERIEIEKFAKLSNELWHLLDMEK